jgi:GAF domain-containing protein
LIACINLRNKTIGALQLQAQEQRLWTDDDMALVEAITDQLSQTAENLRLFEEAQARAGREQTIREITDKLKTAPNLDMLLETAARELGLRLGARHTVLEMGTERETNGAERHEGPVETGQVETSQAETGQQE